MRLVPGKPMTFTASEVVQTEEYQFLEWAPFFWAHDARYMLYWRLEVPRKEEYIAKSIEPNATGAAGNGVVDR